jgi:hypothetical protein
MMELTRSRSYSRVIGVSSFGVSELRQVLGGTNCPPVVNQAQFNPFAYREAVLTECERRGIALEAYSPVGTGRHLSDPTVTSIADRLGRTPAQVLLRWCVERAVPVLAKSTRFDRLEENVGAAREDSAAGQGDDLCRRGRLLVVGRCARVRAQRAGRAAGHHAYHVGRLAAVREDPWPPVGVEDGREPAHAVRGVPAAHGVEAHVDGFARVPSPKRRRTCSRARSGRPER